MVEVITRDRKMSVRVYFMASYAPEGVKGIIGGSDRIAAVEQVVSADRKSVV